MADFFNTSFIGDLELLHKSVRKEEELNAIVESVEWEIINAFSQRDMEAVGTYEAFFEYEFGRDPGEDVKVRLVGYNAENPENSDAGLKEAMRRTIAEIVSWILRNYEASNGVKSIKQGSRSITYETVAPSYDSFPSGWDRKLKNYDARISLYSI